MYINHNNKAFMSFMYVDPSRKYINLHLFIINIANNMLRVSFTQIVSQLYPCRTHDDIRIHFFF